MAVYPDPIADLLDRLEHAGELAGPAASGRAVNFACGGFVEIFVQISEDQGAVSAARFRSNGCGFMVAAAEAICSELNGAGVADLHGLQGTGDMLSKTFGTAPPARTGCFEAVVDAVKAAFREHRDRVVAEFAGEKALVCTCFGISEDTIVEFIANESPSTVEEVSEGCRAGSGCGSCRMIIQELIDSAEREQVMTKS